MHVGNPAYTHTLGGWIPKIRELNEGLDWVGPAGLVICDDNGFGELADSLRTRGFSVVGSSAGGDRLEDDREHARKVFAAHGIQTIPRKRAHDKCELRLRPCIVPVNWSLGIPLIRGSATPLTLDSIRW